MVIPRSFSSGALSISSKLFACPPTFSAYAQFALIQGAGVVEIPLDPNFDFDGAAFVETATKCLATAFSSPPSPATRWTTV